MIHSQNIIYNSGCQPVGNSIYSKIILYYIVISNKLLYLLFNMIHNARSMYTLSVTLTYIAKETLFKIIYETYEPMKRARNSRRFRKVPNDTHTKKKKKGT